MHLCCEVKSFFPADLSALGLWVTIGPDVEFLCEDFVLKVGVGVEVKVDFVARLDVLKLFHLQLVQILKAVLFLFFNYGGHLTMIASKRRKYPGIFAALSRNTCLLATTRRKFKICPELCNIRLELDELCPELAEIGAGKRRLPVGG